jgi:hypothetical protein
VFASVINGASDSMPLIQFAYDLLNGMEFLAHPDGVERMNVILDQTAKLLFNMDKVFAKNIAWLVPFIGSVMNALLPMSYTMGSFAPYYDRLSGLLDRTSAAFPVINGKVRMQIEVTLDTMPGLAAALPPGPSGPPAPPAPPAPNASLASPPAGGR